MSNVPTSSAREWCVAVQIPLWFYRHSECGCSVVRVMDWCAYSRAGRLPRIFCFTFPEVDRWSPFFCLFRRLPTA